MHFSGNQAAAAAGLQEDRGFDFGNGDDNDNLGLNNQFFE